MNILKNKKYKSIVYTFLGILLCFLLWESIAFLTKESFIPEFFKTFINLFALLGEKKTLLSLGYTLLRLVISFFISAVLGTVLGILSGYYSPLGKILAPLMTILKSVPTIALAMLLVIYVPNFSLYVTSIVLFPLIYQASYDGSEKTYSIYEYELILKGRRHLSNITRVILPLSMDYILLGFFQAFSLGMKVEVMAETFGYKSDFYGLGKALSQSFSDVDYLKMMSYVLLIIIVSLLLDFLLLTCKKAILKKLGLDKEKKSIFSF